MSILTMALRPVRAVRARLAIADEAARRRGLVITYHRWGARTYSRPHFTSAAGRSGASESVSECDEGAGGCPELGEDEKEMVFDEYLDCGGSGESCS